MSTSRFAAPATVPLMTLHVDVEASVPIEATERGTTMFIPIVGGRASGDRIAAEICRGGGDWATDWRSGDFHVHARYRLRTDDGVVIGVDNIGVWREIEPGSAYFVTAPRFAAPPGRYEWLNRQVCLGMALERSPTLIEIDVYALTPGVTTAG